jgi:hypothetical protein
MPMQMNAEEEVMEHSYSPESSTSLAILRKRIETIEENLKELPKCVESMPEKGIQHFILGLIKSTDLTISIIKRVTDICISQQYLQDHASDVPGSSKP